MFTNAQNSEILRIPLRSTKHKDDARNFHNYVKKQKTLSLQHNLKDI